MNISKILVSINNKNKLNSITFKDNKEIEHTNYCQNNSMLKQKDNSYNENSQYKNLQARRRIPWVFLGASLAIAIIYFRYLIKVELPELRRKYGKILDRIGNLSVNSGR